MPKVMAGAKHLGVSTASSKFQAGLQTLVWVLCLNIALGHYQGVFRQNMADRRLQIFREVARQQSFARAAHELFLSPSSVTSQVKQLEAECNARLINREHGNISLTPAGQLVFDYAERILALSDEMEQRLGEMSGEMQGVLRIGACPHLARRSLPGLLETLNNHFPKVRPSLLTLGSLDICQRVIDGELDVGLVVGRVDGEALDVRPCAELELVAICAPDYPLADSRQIALKSLVDYEFLSRETGSGTGRAFADHLSSAGLSAGDLKIQMELSDSRLLGELAVNGLGFAVVPRDAYPGEVEGGRLREVSLKPRLHCPVSIVVAKEIFRTRLVTSFVDMARQHLLEGVS